MSWTKPEIQLNNQIRYSTGDARFHAYVDIAMEKEMLMWTSKWNGMEDQLWAEPTVAEMESEDGTEPYSIPAFINEDTNGLWDPQDGGTVWTTIQTIDPTAADVNSQYVPQQLTYNSTTLNNPENVVSKFDDMWMAVRFDPPQTHRQYFEDPRLNKQMILASREGRRAFQALIRAGQDHFVAGAQDPSYPNPVYYGIPVVYVESLDTATLYENTASDDTVDEENAGIFGPRFYWVNGNYLYPVFHDEVYCEKQEITKHHNQPDTWVCPVLTWYNIICTSRRRQGILSPAQDMYYGTTV